MAMFGKHHGKLFAAGESYAKYRPQYPAALLREVFKFVGGSSGASIKGDLAVDVGCGTGQVTHTLAPHYRRVVGIDPSASQLVKATKADNVEYLQGSADKLPVADGSVDLITVAQAMHWIDQDDLWKESNRALKRRGVVAVWGYALASLPDHAAGTAVLENYHYQVLGDNWEPNRRLLDDGYVHLRPPFEEQAKVELRMEKRMPFEAFMGYLGTQSALKTLRERQPGVSPDPLVTVRERLLESCSMDPAGELLVSWPLYLHLCRKE